MTTSISIAERFSLFQGERRRKEELDNISASLRKDLELRTEQKRELEDVVMNLNIDLEKVLRDREELRQALRVKQTVTQGCDNARFDEEILQAKDKLLADVEEQLKEKERELAGVRGDLEKEKCFSQELTQQLETFEETLQVLMFIALVFQ